MRSLEKVAVQGRLVNIKIGRNGRIAGIDELGPAKPDSPVAIPGMIDLHVHSRQPGGNHKEDWDHLWKAAVKGGVTTIVTMPNTSPPIVDLETLQLARELASSSLIKPLFWFGATAKDNSSAIKLACQEKDVVGIKMFMGSSTEAMTIEKPEDQLRVLRLGAKLRVPVAIHAETEARIQANLAALKDKPTVANHSKIRDTRAEVTAVKQALDLAKRAGCQVYFLHISTPEAAELIIRAQANGQLVWFEVTSHHLFLDDDFLQGEQGGFYKMNPPLRNFEQVAGLLEIFSNDQADTVGSDHAPHTREEKVGRDYAGTPSGVPGIETSLPLLINQVLLSQLSWECLVQYTSTRPAEILNLRRKGQIAIGSDADLVVIDPGGETRITNQNIASKCGWTPFDGLTTRGRIVSTIVGGQLLYKEG